MRGVSFFLLFNASGDVYVENLQVGRLTNVLYIFVYMFSPLKLFIIIDVVRIIRNIKRPHNLVLVVFMLANRAAKRAWKSAL
jgi:hypothetical protein